MKTPLALALCLLVGCISGEAKDTLNISEQLSLPSSSSLSTLNGITQLGSYVQLPTFSYPVDVSSALSKLSNVGTLSVAVNSNSFTADDLSSIHSILIEITQNNSTQGDLVLSNYTTTPGQNPNHIDLDIENFDAVAQYLETGPVMLNITLLIDPNMLPAVPETISYDLDLTADVSVNKSL